MAEERWKGEERRRFPRINAKIPVEYRILSTLTSLDFEVLEHKTFKNYTKNISSQGLCINTDRIIPNSTILELVIKFPEQPVKAIAKVIWSNELEPGKFYTGVQYIAIADNQVNAMIQSIAEFLVDSYKLHEKTGIKELLVQLFSKKKED